MPQDSKENPKLCPLRGMEPCSPDCAWRRGGDCAVTLLAIEAFAATEAYIVVNRLQAGEENKEVNGNE